MKRKIITLWMILSLVLSGLSTSTYAEVTFTDIDGHWAKADILTLAEKGVVNGKGNNKFDPNGIFKVDECIKVALTSIGYQFDTSGYTYWASPYIQKAIELHIITESQFANFERAVTREEMACIFVNAFGYVGTVFSSSMNHEIVKSIGDYSLIQDYYKDYVLRCYNVGLMQGSGGLFRPKATATRAEAVTVIMRLTNPDRRIPYKFDAPYTMGTYIDWRDGLGWDEFQDKIYAPKNTLGKYETAVIDLYDFLKENQMKDVGYYDVVYSPFTSYLGSRFVPLSFDEYSQLNDTDKVEWVDFYVGVDIKAFNSKNSYPYQIDNYYYGEGGSSYLKEEYGLFLSNYFDVLFEAEAEKAEKLFYSTIANDNATELEYYFINNRNVKINRGKIYVSEKIK